ncbi:MAG: hypothetical protein LBT67_01495 [Holosporaceae bacterium]|jgi:hypothetical protein|nr:hypothetical protein [Holosporaceae bacterium]
MKNISSLLAAVVMTFFNAERMQAMVKIEVPAAVFNSLFSDRQFSDITLKEFYIGMDNRKSFWEKTEKREKREEFWSLLRCIDDGRVLMIKAFHDDGCTLTTENIAKVITEYFRVGRYLTEYADCSGLFGTLTEPEQKRAKTIMKENFSQLMPLLGTLRIKRLENQSTKWLLETIVDAE